MLQAVVVGNVWSTKRIAGLPSGAFLEVEVSGSGERLVAFDVLGSGKGERVLVAQGSVAAGPVDALIIGSIDEPTTEPEPAAEPGPAAAEPESAAEPGPVIESGPAAERGPANQPGAPPRGRKRRESPAAGR